MKAGVVSLPSANGKKIGAFTTTVYASTVLTTLLIKASIIGSKFEVTQKATVVPIYKRQIRITPRGANPMVVDKISLITCLNPSYIYIYKRPKFYGK